MKTSKREESMHYCPISQSLKSEVNIEENTENR
jgi:uncharacterized OsmC-like protein